MKVWIISKHFRERAEIESMAESANLPYSLHDCIDKEDLRKFQDGDIVVGRIPHSIMFDVDKDIDLYVPFVDYKKEHGASVRRLFYKHILRSVGIPELSETSTFRSVIRLGLTEHFYESDRIQKT